MVVCHVKGCKSRSRKFSDPTDLVLPLLHRFPAENEKERCKKWIVNFGSDNLPKETTICVLDFTPDQFEIDRQVRQVSWSTIWKNTM